MHPLGRSVVALAATGAATLGYASGYEVRAFRLREATVPVLPPGSDPLTVLHVSDLHLAPWQRRKREWVRRLAGIEPDLVINTGDNIAHRDAVGPVVEAYGPLLDLPGVFVFGSNDYFAPILKNPAHYLLPRASDLKRRGGPLPWRDLRDAFAGRGWVDLSNRTATVKVNGLQLAFAGVDDPHLGYDNLTEIAGPPDPSADLAIGVTHAPYLRVLDAMCADGYRIVFAGHTHGGQLRVPRYGALVTNCDLDTRRSRGLHRHRASWLHVSAGLGTSPYAPVRVCCPPEASLVTLTPARAVTGSGPQRPSG